MAESDDEYNDRKRRDKFRGERSSGGGGAGGGDNYRAERNQDNRGGGRSSRDDWQDRNPFGRNRARPTYGDYRRDRFSPGREMPPSKRMRPDWGDDLPRRYGDPYGLYGWGGGHEGYGMHGFGGGGFGGMGGHGGNRGDSAASSNDVQTQPAMLTLKQFLDTQDDTISDSEVLKKYSEYKLDFRRQQLNEFFVTHKDEEWFKLKYHPEESVKRKEEVKEFLQRRVEVFTELLDKDLITAVSGDTSQSEPLIRLLDTVVIKLEGGSEDDLKILDQKPEPEVKIVERKDDDDVIITSVKTKKDDKDEKKEEKISKKRKRSRSDSSDSSSGSDSSDWDEEDNKEKAKEKKEEEVVEDVLIEKKPEAEVEEPKEDVPDVLEEEKPSEPTDTPDEEEKEKSPVPATAVDESKDEVESVATPKTDDLEVDEEETEKSKEREVIYSEKVYTDPPPRALHKTSSIFLRNLSPSITKAEIEAVCKKFEGFLRVAIADPSVDRRWYRRGWVTFSRDVNIKEICWSLNNIRLRDCEMGAIVNRDLSRRVRPVNGVTLHKTIVRNDIKTCAKIIMGLDGKFQLWDDVNTESSTNGKGIAFGFNSKNPLLKNIADYLIEEASAEEEELLGLSGDSKEKDEGEVIERDEELVKVLDKLILYLRIVHSMDFYNHCEYPYEDEMPNRCGIIHARGPAPSNKITSNEIQDYIKNFENKISTFITKPEEIQDEEMKSLGCKNADSEVDKFIQANTQELAKDKWLCPLSGKKFKGPEFIKKHILNKHGEKIDEVRKEVEYYNNYLKDPKRPQLPEHPGNNKRTTSESSNGPPGFRGYPPMYPPYGVYPPMGVPMRGRGGYGGRGRDSGPEHQRRVIGYHDLDTPNSFDIFD